MEFIHLSSKNIFLLEELLNNTIPNSFRYFKERDINVIKSHKLTLVGKLENKIISYGHIDFENDTNWLGLFVLEKYQKRGFGKQILNYLINFIKFSGITNVKLSVDIDNWKALNLYLKYNFQIDEIKKKIYILRLTQTPIVEISLGEALDKLTILEIKKEKIKDERLTDVVKEYNLLFEKLENYVFTSKNYYKFLLEINKNIWEMQDIFRNSKDIEIKNKLCMDIINENDRRFRIKKKINYSCNSNIKEQKGYKMSKVLVLTHLGLGDNITAIGLVRYLSTLYDEVHVVCKSKNKNNLELFYEDDESIKILPVENDNNISPTIGYGKKKFLNFIKVKQYENFYLTGLHNFEKKCDYNCLPFCFYEQLNLDYNIFWKYFYINTNQISLDLFSKVENMDYIFVHNTSSNMKVFDLEEIENKLNLKKDNILFVNPCLNFYEKDHDFYTLAGFFVNKPLIHYTEIIKNANYNILSDSSFFCMAINLEIKNNNNFYKGRNRNYDYFYDKYKFDNDIKRKIFKNLDCI